MGGSFRYAMALMGMVLKSAASQRGADLAARSWPVSLFICVISLYGL
jgi:hypothetical protein